MEAITFTLEPADMAAFHKFLAKRSKSWRLSRYVIVSASVGILAFSAWSELQPYHSLKSLPWFSLLETFVLPVLISVSVYAYYRFQAKKQALNEPLFNNTQTFSLEEKELVWRHLGATTIRKWPSITEIVSDETAIYFYVGELVEHFVPKRVFQNPEQARQFQELAVARWKGIPLTGDRPSHTWPPPPRVKA